MAIDKRGKTRRSPTGAKRWNWAKSMGLSPERLADPAFVGLYPFEPYRYAVGGNIIRYLDEGDGEPVVMLHGNPTWSFFYRNLVMGLRDRYRCLVPDHLGCGLSDKPQRHRYRLENHIANLESWLEALLPPEGGEGGAINLVVHDWGGPIGFGYAVRHPGRIRRLAVMNTSIFTDGSLPRRIRLCRLPFLGALVTRGLNLFAGLAAKSTTVKPLSRETANGYLLPYNSWKNRIGIHSFVKDIPLAKDSPTGKLFQEISDGAAQKLADKPMLIQWGMRDWCFTPSFLGLWRRRFPKAAVNELRAGHYLLEDAGPEVLARLKSFLEEPAP